jgi:ubiquitin-conjugating enzyme E2 variant
LSSTTPHATPYGYSPIFRAVEISSIVLFFIMEAFLAVRLWPLLLERPALSSAMGILAYLGADFVSGIVHWLADTWGSSELPIIGPALVRPFREHHVDPKGITRHDFVETNGANCLISLPSAGLAVGMMDGAHAWADVTALFLTLLIFFVMLTNQFHKWAHTDRPPVWVRSLQRAHVILPVGHHNQHHQAPYAKNYCITAGWMNYVLERIYFFRGFERLITAVTGYLPREDDLAKTSASPSTSG